MLLLLWIIQISLKPAMKRTSKKATDSSVPVGEILSMRDLLRRPTGIELSRLNQGHHQNIKETPTSVQPVHSEHFQGETKIVDIDKHMYVIPHHWTAYIRSEFVEKELKRRRTGNAEETQEGMLSKYRRDSDAEFFRVSEKYKRMQQEVLESKQPTARPRRIRPPNADGDATLSAAMLNSVPEVDLGVRYVAKSCLN